MNVNIKDIIDNLRGGERVRVGYKDNVYSSSMVVVGTVKPRRKEVCAYIECTLGTVWINHDHPSFSITSIEILSPSEPEIGSLVVDANGWVYQRINELADNHWYQIKSNKGYYWSEIAHKVRVVTL